MKYWRWLGTRDPGYAALRRAGRTAIIMPALFAFGDKVIGNPEVATYAAFGSFAMLLLVDFGGPVRDRLLAQTALGLSGAVFVCLGTLASQWAWLAAIAMGVVGFAVLFSGVVSSVLAGATTSLLLAFILPVSLASPPSTIPDRLAGWGLAAAVAIAAVGLLWPAPVREPLRGPATAAIRALAHRMRTDVAYAFDGDDRPSAEEHAEAGTQATAAVEGLRKAFLATPYRPTGLTTSTRTLVRLVDELGWLNAITALSVPRPDGLAPNEAAGAVKIAAADLLDRTADHLDHADAGMGGLVDSAGLLREALAAMEASATVRLPVARSYAQGEGTRGGGSGEAGFADVDEFITSLDPTFRAQELAFAALQVAGNVELTVAAERRSWPDRLLGRQPVGVASTLAAAQERAAAHVERHSVWLHNSIRGAVGLAAAVLVANLTGVQHSFWVVLGALSVLRSSALNTGQNALRGLLGTAAGFVIAAGLIAVIGTDPTVLWFLLPIAILCAGVAPTVISFAAGQAAFTVTLVILFNIIAPAGWRVGLLRVEDIAIGCAVSLAVGVLFWPRGASSALNRTLAEAYRDSATYLSRAVEFAVVRCDRTATDVIAPTADAIRAAAASRRLDDAFRTYLAEPGEKPVPLAGVTSLVTGVAGLRLAADAVLDLWQRDDGRAPGDRTAARLELMDASIRLLAWYDRLAMALVGRRDVDGALSHDRAADARLVAAVRHDLRGADGNASATAVRMIWTGDHLDAARRLQAQLVTPAQATAAANRRADPLEWPQRLFRRAGANSRPPSDCNV